MDSNSESVWYGAPPAPETLSAPEPQHEDERHVRLRTDARYFLLLSLALGAVFAWPLYSLLGAWGAGIAMVFIALVDLVLMQKISVSEFAGHVREHVQEYRARGKRTASFRPFLRTFRPSPKWLRKPRPCATARAPRGRPLCPVRMASRKFPACRARARQKRRGRKKRKAPGSA